MNLSLALLATFFDDTRVILVIYSSSKSLDTHSFKGFSLFVLFSYGVEQQTGIGRDYAHKHTSQLVCACSEDAAKGRQPCDC